MNRYRLNSMDGEMEPDPQGEWVHVDDVQKDANRDQLWREIYVLTLTQNKFAVRPDREADNAVALYDKRKAAA